jgi:hypothetical protein
MTMRKGQINWLVSAAIVVFALIIIALILYKTGTLGTTPVIDPSTIIP